MKNLPKARLLAMPVEYPPVPEQRRIAEILDTLDEAIRKTEQVIAKLQQMKQGLLHDLRTRGIDENGELRDPVRHPEQFKDSPLGRIPKEWEVCSLAGAATTEAGSTVIGPFGSNLVAADYQTRGVPVIFVRDCRVTGFEWRSEVYVSEKKAIQLRAHDVRAGDVIATKMGLPPCVSSVYPAWMPNGVITADMIRLRPNTNLARSEWISTFINGYQVGKQVQAITGGVTRPKVTLRDFRELRIALPNLNEQSRALQRIESLEWQVREEASQLSKLRLLKQGLMDDLLTGHVRVKVTEAAE
jgi:type I restriction enzyme S subunit